MNAIVVDGLTVTDSAGRRIVDEVSFEVAAGRTLGIVGESGSGKSTVLRALLGAVAPGLNATGGVTVDGIEVLRTDRRTLASLRRERLAHLGQDPASALTPTMRVEACIAERLAVRSPATIESCLTAVGLPTDATFRRRRPRQLSGGQQQRLALARAAANEPAILLLDEPTTGLDVVTQSFVLDQLVRDQQRSGRTIVVVSHDLAVIAQLADDIVVMRGGAAVEAGPLVDCLADPTSAYLEALVRSCPDLDAWLRSGGSGHHDAGGIHHPTPVVQVDGLHAAYRMRGRPSVVAADDVTFHVHPGECVALVGSSGSGKSTIARCAIGTHRPDAGSTRLHGHVLASAAADRTLDERRRVQLVPQDPWSTLNPQRPVVDAIARSAQRYRGLDRLTAIEVARSLMAEVELQEHLADRRPGQLSGGERQRVAIARALAARPDMLVCDEITSALDVSVQAAVLDLLGRLRAELGLAMLFITHDLGVVARIADRVLVLDRGRVCEHGSLAEVFAHPDHEVTTQLITASPSLSAVLAHRTRTAGPHGASVADPFSGDANNLRTPPAPTAAH
jgi:peptide/nickel transport system ATP-binding protein